MAQLEYVKGSVFDAPKGVILAHACNAQGSWGSGVALEFKKRFPDAYAYYHKTCFEFLPLAERSPLVGKAFTYFKDDANREDYGIGCLVTSNKYGKFVDSPDMIVKATDTAIEWLFVQAYFSERYEIHTPKINSNLFRVPWERTEAVIKDQLLRHSKMKWVVWEYEAGK